VVSGQGTGDRLKAGVVRDEVKLAVVTAAQTALNDAIRELPDDVVVEVGSIDTAMIGQVGPREIVELKVYQKTHLL